MENEETKIDNSGSPKGVSHTIVPEEYLAKVGDNWDKDVHTNQIIIDKDGHEKTDI